MWLSSLLLTSHLHDFRLDVVRFYSAKNDNAPESLRFDTAAEADFKLQRFFADYLLSGSGLDRIREEAQ